MLEKPLARFERILAVRLDNIGDVIMLGPALRALREQYPKARITLMASPAGTQAAALLPWIDDVITWRAVWQDIAKDVPAEPAKELELFALLRKKQFDAAFIFTSFSQSPHPPAYACYMAGIPVRVGQSKEFGGGLLTHWVCPPEDGGYQVERNTHLLKEVGIQVISERLELVVPEVEQSRVQEILAGYGLQSKDPFIVLAPGASATARRYSEERFAQAALLLVEQTGLPLVVIGSPREAGKFPAIETLAKSNSRVHSLIGQTTVAGSSAVIAQSALLIANNSGSLHMGAALNRPMVILYSGTETLEQWTPKDAQVRILNQVTSCAPCHLFQCPYQMECLDIPPEAVAAEAVSLLQAPAVVPDIHSLAGNGPARR